MGKFLFLSFVLLFTTLFLHAEEHCYPKNASCLTLHAYGAATEKEVLEIFIETMNSCSYQKILPNKNP